MQKTIKRKSATKGQYASPRGLAARVALVENTVKKADIAEYAPGDTVRVHTRIQEGEKERIQVYEGVIIARSSRGTNRTFTVRKISHGVGVERIFSETSPRVARLEVVQSGRVRRAKLYYLRSLEGKAAKLDRQADAVTAKPETKN